MENKYYTPELSEFHVGFEYEQQQFWLVIPDRTKVSKEEWDNYINRLLTKPITEQMKTNYNLYYEK